MERVSIFCQKIDWLVSLAIHYQVVLLLYFSFVLSYSLGRMFAQSIVLTVGLILYHTAQAHRVTTRTSASCHTLAYAMWKNATELFHNNVTESKNNSFIPSKLIMSEAKTFMQGTRKAWHDVIRILSKKEMCIPLFTPYSLLIGFKLSIFYFDIKVLQSRLGMVKSFYYGMLLLIDILKKFLLMIFLVWLINPFCFYWWFTQIFLWEGVCDGYLVYSQLHSQCVLGFGYRKSLLNYVAKNRIINKLALMKVKEVLKAEGILHFWHQNKNNIIICCTA